MLVADFNLLEHLSDHPWHGCTLHTPIGPITWMSSGIASMIIVGLVLLWVIPRMARKDAPVPRGLRHVIELVVVFVREMIARPALHGNAERYLPFLLTLFVFILGMNFFGLLPIIDWTRLTHYPVGGAATSIATVCGALAMVTLVRLMYESMAHQVKRYQHKGWPKWLAVLLSPLLWIANVSHPIPGTAGIVMWPMMTILDFIGVFARCFALMIRLFANILAGHTLLAVMMMFIVTSLESALKGDWVSTTYIPAISTAASVIVYVMEILVDALQAYIFTFLTAMFIGFGTAEESH